MRGTSTAGPKIHLEQSCSSFRLVELGSAVLSIAIMSKTQSESSDDFEFIETPAAPTSQPPPEDCGVRTTSVCVQ